MAESKFSTAAQLRARPIVVTVAGDGEIEPVRILCRRPDPLALFSSELLPLAIYAKVAETVIGSVNTFSRAVVNDPIAYGDFIDRWVCAATVSPRVVLMEAEASDDAIWVEDLTPEVRAMIFTKTTDRLSTKRVIDAVAEFRRGQSVDPDIGSDGAAVQHTAVESLVGR